MSGDGYGHSINDDMDYAAAVAAAAYVIHSLEEHLKEQHIGHERDTPLMRPKSGRTATFPAQEPRSSSKRFSGNITEEKSHELRSPAKKTPEKSPSIGKNPTLSVMLGGSDTKQTEDSREKPKKPVSPAPSVLPKPPPPPLPPPPPRQTLIKGQRLTGHGAEADAWEKAELVKVKGRYEKLSRMINSWEVKKIAKARKKLEKTENELRQRRRKVLLNFREDMEYIDQIAGGVRAQAKERRRNEGNKVKEKANFIRKTGKVPSSTCLCL